MSADTRMQRRADIIRAATLEFTERGFERAKMEEIARRAGIGKSTVYEYFPSKTELLAEVLTQGVEYLHRQIGQSLSAPGPVAQKLGRLLAGAGTVMRGPLGTLLAARDCAPVISFMKEHGEQEREFLLRHIGTVVQCGMEAGELRADLDARFAAGMILALLMTMSSGLIPSELAPDAQRHLVNLLLEGIGPQPVRRGAV